MAYFKGPLEMTRCRSENLGSLDQTLESWKSFFIPGLKSRMHATIFANVTNYY